MAPTVAGGRLRVEGDAAVVPVRENDPGGGCHEGFERKLGCEFLVCATTGNRQGAFRFDLLFKSQIHNTVRERDVIK